ncbi:MAG: ABC transporter permease, partial [Azonexus sp.]|nr:ABC transporter permease [Azonexus sp.]
NIMLAAPTTYFVRMAQAILYRGAGFDVIWRDLLAMMAVGGCFFAIALLRFRKAVTQTQG